MLIMRKVFEFNKTDKLAVLKKQKQVAGLVFYPLFVHLNKYSGIMRTLNVSISDVEYNKFGIKNDKLTFTDLIDIVSKELTRQNLNKCLELANKFGLSKMTMDEIPMR